MYIRLTIIGLVLFCGSYAEAVTPLWPKGKNPQTQEYLARYFAPLEVTVTPEKPEYFQGEEIWVKVIFTSPKPTDIPLIEMWIQSMIYLFSEGEEVPATRGGSSELGRIGPTTREEFRIRLDGDNGSANSVDEFGFFHLLPGQYTGYYLYGIRSPEFSFAVLAPPAKSMEIWDQYRYVKALTVPIERSRIEIDSVNIDSVRMVMTNFSSLETNHIWKSEGLQSVLYIMGSLRSRLNQTDSLMINNALLELSRENRVTTEQFIASVYWGLVYGGSNLAETDTIQRIHAFRQIHAMLPSGQLKADIAEHIESLNRRLNDESNE